MRTSSKKSRKVLLLVAHGSRREDANRDVEALAIRLQARLEEVAVKVAYLELASPLFVEGIDTVVGDGAREVLVLPYFLSGGVHVAEDLPRLVEDARKRWPGVRIDLLPHLGADPLLLDALAERAKEL